MTRAEHLANIRAAANLLRGELTDYAASEQCPEPEEMENLRREVDGVLAAVNNRIRQD